MLTIKKHRFDVTPNSSIVNCQLSIVNSRRAFTLVELLVVITIIGILSSLVTVAVGGARRAAQRTKIAMEIGQISAALEQYKEKFGEYPPDLSNDKAVVRHVKKRWPRFQLDGGTPEAQFEAFLRAAAAPYKKSEFFTPINTLSNGEISVSSTTHFFAKDGDRQCGRSAYIAALPLWLGGYPNKDGKLSGFSADPEAPFGRKGDGKPVTGELNESTVSSLDNQDGNTVFMDLVIGQNIRFVITKDTPDPIVFPTIVYELRSDLKVPYVYFCAKQSGGTEAYLGKDDTGTTVIKSLQFDLGFDGEWKNLGEAVPYAKASTSSNITWFGADTYQLIHPGLDGIFGVNGNSNETNENTFSSLTDPFSDQLFRSIQINANGNKIRKPDYDNLTNFSGGSELKTFID